MIKVPSNPFSKISEVIKKYEKSIEYIASGGINRTINYQNYKEKRPQLNIMLRGLNYLQRDLVALHNNFIIKSPVLINT